MKCEDYLRLIDKKLDGEIAPDESSVLEDHLKKCPDCRDYADMFSGLTGGSLVPSNDFEEKAMARIEKEAVIGIADVSQRKKSRVVYFAKAAALIIAASAAFLAIKMAQKPQTKGDFPISIEMVRELGKSTLAEGERSLRQSSDIIRPKPLRLSAIAKKSAIRKNRETLEHDYELTKATVKSLYEEIASEIGFL